MGRTLDDAMRVLRNKTTSLQKKRRKLTGTDAPDYVFNLNRAVGHQSRRVSQAMQDIVMSATARRAHPSQKRVRLAHRLHRGFKLSTRRPVQIPDTIQWISKGRMKSSREEGGPYQFYLGGVGLCCTAFVTGTASTEVTPLIWCA